MARCPLCKRSTLKCGHNLVTPTTRRKTGFTKDANGIDWCNVCRCRGIDGKCTNYTCSTRK